MKEIGLQFQESRENIGISIDEVASDLKVEKQDLENLEAGNIKSFANVVSLKYLIRDYSKYLGLNAEDILDEYNEYLFDQTSKISLDDIKAAKKRLAREAEIQKEDKVRSPYTNSKKNESRIVFVIVLSILLVMIATVAIYFVFKQKPVKDDHTISYIRWE